MNPPKSSQKTAGGRGSGSGAATGFLRGLFSSLGGSTDLDREKRKALKKIARDLRKTRLKLYHPTIEMADAHLARFFFEIYQAVGPARVILEKADSSKVLRAILVERTLAPESLKQKERLAEEALRARAAEIGLNRLVQETRETIKAFYGGFDARKVREIDADFRNLSVLLALIRFDYYFLLRKFDSRLPEGVFTYEPRFESISLRYIIDELQDFLEILRSFDPQIDWEKTLDTLRQYRGLEAISRDAFRKMLRSLREIQRANVLEMIVQLFLKDPYFQAPSRAPRGRLVEEYLAELKLNTELVLQKLVQEHRTSNQEELARKVFGTAAVSRLSHYTEKLNEPLARKMAGGFTHVAALNCVKAFLQDHVRRDMREIIDLLVIPAKWSESSPSQVISDSFHQLLEIQEELSRFDESLDEAGETGRQLYDLLARVERGPRQQLPLRKLVHDINEQARLMVQRTTEHCIALGKVLKLLIDDEARSHPELLLNWKEVRNNARGTLRSKMIAMYKQLYYFVQLLQAMNK